ncbi:DedA family protein [Arthrobacter psychrolactophilus]
MIEHSAAQWWVIPLVSLFCLIDGFFLFLPSETAIVALASISAKTGAPNIWLLILGASVGAIIGDNIAYFLGRKLGTTRFNWMRRPRGAKAFAWAGKELEKRGAILIFTARYIPVGRVAVNFTAGATYFPWRRFALLDGIAVVTWAGYSVAVGTFAGRWVHDNPLLGVVIAVVFAVVIGFVVSRSHEVRPSHPGKAWQDRPAARARLRSCCCCRAGSGAGLSGGRAEICCRRECPVGVTDRARASSARHECDYADSARDAKDWRGRVVAP